MYLTSQDVKLSGAIKVTTQGNFPVNKLVTERIVNYETREFMFTFTKVGYPLKFRVIKQTSVLKLVLTSKRVNSINQKL